MKNSLVLVVFVAGLFTMIPQTRADAMPGWPSWSDNGDRDPAAAALLSLIPVPAALGHFYVGDWRTALLFSFAETAEAATVVGVGAYEEMSVLRTGGTMRDWDGTGQAVFFSALGAFALTKFIDAFTAGLAAEAKNKRISPEK